MIHAPTPNCLRHVLLAILPVTVTSGESIAETFVVWDPGSGATLFTDNLTARLNLSGPSFRVRFSNFNNSVTIESKIVSFQIVIGFVGWCHWGQKCLTPKNFLTPNLSYTLGKSTGWF